jgi:hypothetical protein
MERIGAVCNIPLEQVEGGTQILERQQHINELRNNL